MAFLFIHFIAALVWTVLFVLTWSFVRKMVFKKTLGIPFLAIVFLFIIFFVLRIAIGTTSFGNFGGGQGQTIPLPNNYYAFYDSDFDHAIIVEGLENTYNDKHAIELGRFEVVDDMIYGERESGDSAFFKVNTKTHEINFSNSPNIPDPDALRSFDDYWKEYWNWRRLIFLF